MEIKIFAHFHDDKGHSAMVIRYDAIVAIAINDNDRTLIEVYTSNHVFKYRLGNEQLAEAELLVLQRQVEEYIQDICDD